uniref:Uncharacterized protein n=1 Tax=viral metagenome TaxID=1070528 RepID=A0A6H1ZVW9_9ZZZZ
MEPRFLNEPSIKAHILSLLKVDYGYDAATLAMRIDKTKTSVYSALYGLKAEGLAKPVKVNGHKWVWYRRENEAGHS